MLLALSKQDSHCSESIQQDVNISTTKQLSTSADIDDQSSVNIHVPGKRNTVNIKIGNDYCQYLIEHLKLLPYFNSYFSQRWMNRPKAPANSHVIIDILGNQIPKFNGKHLTLLVGYAINVYKDYNSKNSHSNSNSHNNSNSNSNNNKRTRSILSGNDSFLSPNDIDQLLHCSDFFNCGIKDGLTTINKELLIKDLKIRKPPLSRSTISKLLWDEDSPVTHCVFRHALRDLDKTFDNHVSILVRKLTHMDWDDNNNNGNNENQTGTTTTGAAATNNDNEDGREKNRNIKVGKHFGVDCDTAALLFLQKLESIILDYDKEKNVLTIKIPNYDETEWKELRELFDFNDYWHYWKRPIFVLIDDLQGLPLNATIKVPEDQMITVWDTIDFIIHNTLLKPQKKKIGKSNETNNNSTTTNNNNNISNNSNSNNNNNSNNHTKCNNNSNSDSNDKGNCTNNNNSSNSNSNSNSKKSHQKSKPHNKIDNSDFPSNICMLPLMKALFKLVLCGNFYLPTLDDNFGQAFKSLNIVEKHEFTSMILHCHERYLKTIQNVTNDTEDPCYEWLKFLKLLVEQCEERFILDHVQFWFAILHKNKLAPRLSDEFNSQLSADVEAVKWVIDKIIPKFGTSNAFEFALHLTKYAVYEKNRNDRNTTTRHRSNNDTGFFAREYSQFINKMGINWNILPFGNASTVHNLFATSSTKGQNKEKT